MHSNVSSIRKELRNFVRKEFGLFSRQYARTFLATRREECCLAIAELLQEQAGLRGFEIPSSGPGEIDWASFFENFLAFIKELLPLILQLVDLFSP
jgi:hypothetical protein